MHPIRTLRLTSSILILGAGLSATSVLLANNAATAPHIEVVEARGRYTVRASFTVPQAPELALAVLSDYEQIPRFMPDVRTSRVRERAPGRLIVEQEAESRFMVFSKKVHLVLEVTESGGAIRFVDRCGKSFTTYEGAWRALPVDGGALITYELLAKPAFDVPEFILKRLLKRDSGEMINRLRREIAERATR